MIRHEAGTVAAARVGFCLGVAAVIWVDSLVAVAWRFRPLHESRPRSRTFQAAWRS